MPPAALDLQSLTPDALRARQTMKWTYYDPDVIPMWVAEMDFPTAAPVIRALHEAVDAESLGYVGAPLARAAAEAFAAYQAREEWTIDPDDVADVPDVMRGIRLALRYLCEPAPVVIPTPVYMPFFDIVDILGLEQIRVPMVWDGARYTLDLDGIDAALSAGARTVLLSNPHNPLGRVWDGAELAALAEVVQRHGGRVVTDEIHGPLALTKPFIPYAECSPTARAHAITVTSASKSWNLPGLKAAQLVTHTDADRQRVADIPMWERIGTSTLGLVAQRAAYVEGVEWLDAVRDQLRANVTRSRARIATWAGVSTLEHEGTYLLWLDFTQRRLDEEPAAWLLREGRVALNNGVAFGAPPHRFARLNVATTTALLDEGLDRIERVLAR